MRPCPKGRPQAPCARGRFGFTLIEVLTAITILVLIIMMVSAMFGQFRMAWRSSLMRTAKHGESRAALDFMMQEMATAVADSKLHCDIRNGLSWVEFYSLGAGDDRVVGYVKYGIFGGKLQRGVKRSISYWPAGKPVPTMQTVMEEVEDLRFTTSTGANHTTNLPQWVEVELKVAPSKMRVEYVDVWSVGKDHKDGTKDDVNGSGT